ncbi:hypothetical protein [Thermovenabulum gondwanense]|uniref:Uncharacterized protein n=1 Tax=Thermovenabulum gondwanense TaxID=520767 RepID=A0A161PVY5_9FIRM|nr:hypothetical protein [Thermovenabulum gondwanense]KYO67281.1 hypothetical protein ATZ99_05670 [Thermovenabulum gondwanense]
MESLMAFIILMGIAVILFYLYLLRFFKENIYEDLEKRLSPVKGNDGDVKDEGTIKNDVKDEAKIPEIEEELKL